MSDIPTHATPSGAVTSTFVPDVTPEVVSTEPMAPITEPVTATIDNSVQPTTDPLAEGAPDVTIEPATPQEPIAPESEEGNPTASEPVELKYGDMTFDLADVEIPEDMATQLTENGFEGDALVRELYDGEFGFSDETKAQLDDKFGKFAVDTYLGMLKQTMDSNNEQHLSAMSQAERESTEAWTATLDSVGGEEGWDAMSKYAEENYSESELAQFNQAMDNGTRFQQDLMIKALAMDAQVGNYASAEPNHAVDVIDVTGSGASTTNNNAPMSMQAYNEAITSPEYAKMSPEERNVVDQRRLAGIRAGV